MHAEYPIVLDFTLLICARPVLALAGDRERSRVPGYSPPETDTIVLASHAIATSPPPASYALAEVSIAPTGLVTETAGLPRINLGRLLFILSRG